MIEQIFMYISAICSFFFIAFATYKKFDIKITLFAMGLFLLYVGTAMGYDIKILSKKIDTGSAFLNPLKAVVEQFIKTLQRAGIIILFLGGYSIYMTKIGANYATIKLFTKPLSKIKNPYILVPFLFLFGNLLSLVVPSASMLAVILLATLYPLLKSVGMSRATGAAIIATTATIMPTPLGGDNIVIAKELNISAAEYVFKYHAMISLPTIIIMAVTHYFVQKFFDKKDIKKNTFQLIDVNPSGNENKDVIQKKGWNILYACLPILPIFILLVIFIINIIIPDSAKINLSVAISTILCLVIALIVESIYLKNFRVAISKTNDFFKGMASAFSVVVLLTAATLFVTGLKQIQLISTFQNQMTNLGNKGLGWVLPLVLVIFTFLIVILSGSGVALFYAMAPLMVGFAVSAGIAAQAVTIPMGMAGNLFRAMSPVAAVIVIISAKTKLSPMAIVKRTAIPSSVGAIFMFTLSMIVFL